MPRSTASGSDLVPRRRLTLTGRVCALVAYLRWEFLRILRRETGLGSL